MSTATTRKRTKRMSTGSEAVNTKQVVGRRALHFDSFDDLLADAEQMASVKTKTLGNWSLGQILKHLAIAINTMIDGSDFMMPAPIRFVMRLLMKKKMLRQTLSPGFKLPEKVRRQIHPTGRNDTRRGFAGRYGPPSSGSRRRTSVDCMERSAN